MRVEVVKDFQYTNEKMQIMVLPTGEVLEKQDAEFYRFKKRMSIYTVPVEIIENNPIFFKVVDWREDLLREMKKNKKSTTPAIHKQVVAYIENEVLFNKEIIENDVMEELLKLVREKYNVTSDKKYLDLFDKVGWAFDKDRIWKKY
jgi:hypothetical protein